MRIYLAARYSRRQELRNCALDLRSFGHEVTSRWIDSDYPPAGAEPAHAPPEERPQIAKEDLQDIFSADLLIAFTEPSGQPYSGRGGRHIEFGYALALEKRILIVGPQENIFHCLPVLEIFNSWPDCLAHITETQ